MKPKINHFLIVLFFIPYIFLSQTKESNAFEKKVLKQKAMEFKNEFNFIEAQSYYQKKDWDSTLVYSIKQIHASKNKALVDYCHYFRGVSFYYKKLFSEAQKELLLVSDHFELSSIKNFFLGASISNLKDFEKALFYFNLSEKQSLLSHDNQCLADAYSGMGTAYIFLKDHKKAEFYLLKNLKLNESAQNKDRMCTSYMNLANLFYEQYKDELAIYYFKKSYETSKEVKSFDKKRDAAKNMAVVEENRKNFKDAFFYQKESDQWKDSLNNQNKIWAVADFEKKFAVAEKQKEIKVLQVENKLRNAQRNSLFFSAIGLILILTGGVYLYAQKVKNSKIILLQKNKLDELNATKDQLFSIVSHDLRSSVNALKTSNSKLSATLETKNYEELNHLIIQNSSIANGTYSLLDNLLHWALLQTKQLYFHKESVHLYSVIQQIEYNYKPLLVEKEIRFENLVSKNIFLFVDLDSLKIVFRNLLDNAIKFTNLGGTITFESKEIDSNLCQVIIKDTGIGISTNTINELLQEGDLLAKKGNSEIIGTGLGLQLCKQMIKKNDGSFTIESEINNGTKMILTFPKTK